MNKNIKIIKKSNHAKENQNLLIKESYSPESDSLTSLTSLNIGKPRCFSPAFLWFTPPTTFVPYSSICFPWKVPCETNVLEKMDLEKKEKNMDMFCERTCFPVNP